MGDGLLTIAEVLLRTSQQRLETISRNIANTSTAGFKRQGVFQDALVEGTRRADVTELLSTYTDHSPSALRSTGMPFDLALSAEGFFRVRTTEGATYYTRNGHFERTPEGLLADDHGLILQAMGGGDLVIADPQATIQLDGVVLEDGLPVARVGVFTPENIDDFQSLGGSLFAATGDVSEVASPAVRQGMLEGANVEMATEMVAMMEALRSAEIGARIAQTYDTLIDGSISTFAKSSA